MEVKPKGMRLGFGVYTLEVFCLKTVIRMQITGGMGLPMGEMVTVVEKKFYLLILR